MTDRAALLMDLAERCEKAEGADRELDAEIWATAVGRVFDATSRRWLKIKRAWPANNGGKDCFWFETASSMQGTNAILYTASLDAALSLVPEGLLRSMLEDPRVSRAVAHVRTKSILDPDTQEWSGYAKALPLALCAAALRALASGAPR